MINKVQELNLKLIECESFNCFDGKEVVKVLRKNRALWQGAWMTRFDLIPLRDMPRGSWNIDTLYLLGVKGKEKELELLAKDWSADEVDWLSDEQCQSMLGQYPPPYNVLKVWWD